MTSFGPIALLGGGEHLPPCIAGDRRLLELTGARSPSVAVIPAASSPRRRPVTAGLAHDHWTSLGVSVSIVGLDRYIESSYEVIERADLIVLPGGYPNRLMRELGSSPLRDLIVDRWSSGAGLAGSSAGAMCLFRHRLRLYPPNPLALLPGLGVLEGFVAAPHFDRFRARRWAERACRFLRGHQVLGIDEDTALVGHLGSLQVFGAGGVTLVSHHVGREYPSGADLLIDLASGSPTAAPPELSNIQSARGSGSTRPSPQRTFDTAVAG